MGWEKGSMASRKRSGEPTKAELVAEVAELREALSEAREALSAKDTNLAEVGASASPSSIPQLKDSVDTARMEQTIAERSREVQI